MQAKTEDLGHCNYGSSPKFTFTFGQDATDQNPNGTPTDPTAAKLKITAPGGTSVDVSASLTHVSAGTYSFPPDTSISGLWTGRAYAPPGSGQASLELIWEVDPTANP